MRKFYGLIRETTTAARTLSRELRTGTDNLRRRRAVVGLSMVGTASLGMVALYQMGIIKHLPEPRLRFLNADQVDASPDAYQWFSTPDALLGIASFATTMVLAGMGGKDRGRKQPLIPVALSIKTAMDVSNAARLTRNQWKKHRAFCVWCLIAAGTIFATAPLVILETLEAIRNLKAVSKRLSVRKAA